MATIAYVLLFLTLSSTIIHARESQFFAKVSNNPQETQPLNTNQNFVPKSQQEEGGAFGHESGQLPPSATNNNNNNNNNNYNNNNNNLPSYLPENYNPVAYTTPIHSSTQDIPNEFNEPQEYNTENTRYNSQNQNEFMGTNGGNNMYNSGKQGMSDTRFMDNGKYYYGNNGYNSPKQGFADAKFMETEDGGNMYNSQKQGFEDARFMETENSGNMYNSQKQGIGMTRYGTSNNANMYNPERQGMSDTRFLENGKYYYDLNMENANVNANMNTRFNSRNEYNTQGYYGNNENSYDRYNSNGGYQNQEEFQGDQFDP